MFCNFFHDQVKYSAASLVEYLGKADSSALNTVAVELLAVLARHRFDARVVIPAYKTLDLLFSNQSFIAMEDDQYAAVKFHNL